MFKKNRKHAFEMDYEAGGSGASVPKKVTWRSRLRDKQTRKLHRIASHTPKDDMVQVDTLPSGFAVVMPRTLLPSWEGLTEEQRAEIMAGMSETLNEAKMRGEIS